MIIKILLVPVLLIILSAITVEAQIGIIKQAVRDKSKTRETKNNSAETIDKNSTDPNTSSEKKNKTYSEKDPNFMFIGKDEMEGKTTETFTVCAQNSGKNNFPLMSKFKLWINNITHYAREDMYQEGKCELMGFIVVDEPSNKYRNTDSFETLAQGDSVYRIEGNKLVLVKDFAAENYYVVVVSEVNKPGLTLKDLNLGLKPDLKESYRKKTKGVYNYHNLKQALYLFEQYKKYPGEMQINSALFNREDFDQLNGQGKFKGLVIYKLEGEKLLPYK